jgi:hypothetical protein
MAAIERRWCAGEPQRGRYRCARSRSGEDGKRASEEIRGILGTLGILARNTGDFERFQECPRVPSGNLATRASRPSAASAKARAGGFQTRDKNIEPRRTATSSVPWKIPRGFPRFVRWGRTTTSSVPWKIPRGFPRFVKRGRPDVGAMIARVDMICIRETASVKFGRGGGVGDLRRTGWESRAER